MRVDQHFLGHFTRNDAFGQRQCAFEMARIDANVIFSIVHLIELPLSQAETPGVAIVTRAVGNPVGVRRKRMQMRLELAQGKPRVHRNRIIDQMQVVAAKINNAAAREILDVSVSNAPLSRYDPVEHGSAAPDLGTGQPDLPAKDVERFANALSRDAATDRVKLLDQGVRGRAQRGVLIIGFGAVANHRPMPS